MNNIQEFIYNPWTVGIGVTILGIIFTWIFNYKKDSNYVSTKVINSTIEGNVISAGRDVIMNSTSKTETPNTDVVLSALEIIEKVKNQPLGLRKKTEESFKGINVTNWPVLLTHINDKDKGIITLSTVDAKNEIYPRVYFDVIKKDYPSLYILNENHKLLVSGKIQQVNGHSIYLKNIRININPKIDL